MEHDLLSDIYSFLPEKYFLSRLLIRGASKIAFIDHARLEYLPLKKMEEGVILLAWTRPSRVPIDVFWEERPGLYCKAWEIRLVKQELLDFPFRTLSPIPNNPLVEKAASERAIMHENIRRMSAIRMFRTGSKRANRTSNL